MKSSTIVSFLVPVLALGACASLRDSLRVKSALPQGPLRVSELANVPLTESAEVGARAMVARDNDLTVDLRGAEPAGPPSWQWRGRNALGAPPQSFVSPQFLGGDDVLIVTLGGGIGVYDLKSGAAKWKLAIPVGVASKPLVKGSHVFVAGMDGLLRKLRLDSGKQEWAARLSSESLGGIASYQSFVYVTTGDDAVWALDDKTGENKWTYKRPSPQSNVYWSLRGNSIPLLSPDGSKIYAGFSDGFFVAMESVSGQTLWERNFERAGRFKDADQAFEMSQDGRHLYLPLVDGDLVVLNAVDGASLWSVPGGGASTPLVDESEGVLYANSNDGALLKVSLKDAKLLWAAPLAKGFRAQPTLLDKDFIAITSADGGLLFVDRANGSVVDRFPLGRSQLVAPAFDGSRLVMLSSRNRFYVFKVESRRTPPAAPQTSAAN